VALPITPQRLAAVYELLRAWPPFCRWGLPPAGEVRFHVLRGKGRDADWGIENGRHHVRLSAARHGHLNSVLAGMAHEMIHMRQHERRTETPGAEHNAEFHAIAARVCRRYGWDEKQFI
jgi:hypothetical protein